MGSEAHTRKGALRNSNKARVVGALLTNGEECDKWPFMICVGPAPVHG